MKVKVAAKRFATQPICLGVMLDAPKPFAIRDVRLGILLSAPKPWRWTSRQEFVDLVLDTKPPGTRWRTVHDELFEAPEERDLWQEYLDGLPPWDGVERIGFRDYERHPNGDSYPSLSLGSVLDGVLMGGSNILDGVNSGVFPHRLLFPRSGYRNEAGESVALWYVRHFYERLPALPPFDLLPRDFVDQLWAEALAIENKPRT